MIVTKIPLWIRLILTIIGCVTAFIFPIILYNLCGLKNSLSLYAADPITANVFNYSLAIIGISLLVRKVYAISSISMLLILYFDVVTYPTIHNLIAALLFLSLTYVLCVNQEYGYSSLMIMNLFILFTLGLYIFELVAILITIIYNLEVAIKIFKREFLK